MKKTGELLRKRREEKGLSLHEIALSLKINSKTLKAIEDGDLSQLPAKTFLRGFVQSYANYLKMNLEEVLAVFTEEMGPTRPQAPVTVADGSTGAAEQNARATEVIAFPRPAARAPETTSSPTVSGIEQTSKTKAVILSAVSLGLIALIVVTKKVIDRYQKESDKTPVAVVSPIEEPIPAPGPGQAAAPPRVPPLTSMLPGITGENILETMAQSAATNSKPEAADAKPAEPKPPEVKPPEPPKPVETAQVQPVPSKPAEIAKPAEPPKTADASKPTETKPTEAPKPVEKKNLELIVEALDAVEIQFSGASGALQKIQLGADQVHTIRSHGALKVQISNGGAVNLTLNGRDLGVPGDLGKPIKLSY